MKVEGQTFASVQASENDESSFRRINLGRVYKKEFCSNKVTTSRYTLLTWLPKSIIIQFARVTNVYNIAIIIMVFFPFSPYSPWSLTSTFILVLMFSSIKEAIEDLSRHKQDRTVNKAKATVYDLNEHKHITMESQDLRVGQILKIHENESIHADLIMLCSSSLKGVAYVNTMNLDGETNLKEKMVSHLTEKIKDENDLHDFKAKFDVDHPNSSLLKWNCNYIHAGNTEPMNMKQLLMRGCMLKNTEWILGKSHRKPANCKKI
jgi:magnesium-transporting ATPase (P-type)